MNNNSTSKTQELAGVSPGTRGLTRDNSRNTWAQQHERRNSIRLLGNVVELDEWLDWRVKWGQRGTAVCGGLAVSLFVLNTAFYGGHNPLVVVAMIVCAVGFFVSMGILYNKNVSLVIARRLVKEVNVVMILMLGLCIFAIDCAKPHNSFSPINGFLFFVDILLFLFLDAMKKKSRVFVLFMGNLFALVNLWNIYCNTFLDDNIGVILFQYGNDYVFRKRSIQRSCFIQISLFSINGLWTMVKDKKMEMMMFATGHIYRETGMIYQGERLLWRVKWGQRLAAVSVGLGFCLFVLNGTFFGGHNLPLFVAFFVCGIVFIIGVGTIYYKNVSFAVTRRLLKEVNVVIILMLGICNFTIDSVKPYNSFSPINGLIFFFSVVFFVFLDTMKKKSRVFVLIIGIIFAIVTLWNIYCNTFLDDNIDVILFQYGDDYVFRKRSIKRSIFIQIFLFSINGLWTMFKDKKMEKMMFATGHIYRETGTASKYVKQESFVQRVRSETGESMV